MYFQNTVVGSAYYRHSHRKWEKLGSRKIDESETSNLWQEFTGIGDCGGFLESLSHKTGEGNGNTLQYSWPGKSHGRRGLVGFSPWGPKELDTTERLHFHFSLSFNGEGNGNPLQCSCLENPRDRGAWWAAVYGVAQSQT